MTPLSVVNATLGRLPKQVTPVGASATTVALVNVALGLLNGWPWYAHQSTTFQTSVSTVALAALTWLAGTLNVLRNPGGTVTMKPSAGPLPTVEVTETPAPVKAAA